MANSTRDDLFQTSVAEADLDPDFVHVRDHDDCSGDREYLERAWRFFRPFADNHFHDQIQRRGNFQARAWELRLAWTLRVLGRQVTCTRPLGPDFSVLGDPRVHFEAVAPQSTDALRQNECRGRSGGAGVPENDMALRATTVISSKRERYQRYVDARVVARGEPYVIAICGANIPQATMSDNTPWILKPLFGLGRAQLTVRLYSNVEPEPGYERVPTRESRNGSDVDMALFTDQRAREVSAILFTPHHIKNRPEYYDRPAGNDFVLVHNPFADCPVPVGFLPRGREYGPRAGEVVLLNDWRTQSIC